MHNAGLTNDLDSQLTDFGIYQAIRTGLSLKNLFEKQFKNVKNFECFVSPYLRCLRTADLIKSYSDLKKFKVYEPIHESKHAHPEDQNCKVPNREIIFDDFDWSDCPQRGWNFKSESAQEIIDGAKDALKGLPEESIVVSHGMPIVIMALLASGENLKKLPEWDGSIVNCSFTMIENGKVTLWGDYSHHI